MHLKKLTSFPGRAPVLLVIMDGVGLAPPGPANAVSLARTPTLDALLASPYSAQLQAHGTAVGLPSDTDVGNSEVGHNTLGGGRVFAQGAKLVRQAIADGSIFASDTWRKVEARGRENTVHFIGLLSDGNVHSHIDHLFALLARCHAAGIASVCVHALLDGRDVPPRSALTYLERLEAKLAEYNRAGCRYRIASGGGRMAITMDRYEADWAMVARGFAAHVHGKVGDDGRLVSDARAEVLRQYSAGDVGDQYLSPFVVVDDAGAAVGAMRDGDAAVLFNFRGDRAVEISRALEEDDFAEFPRDVDGGAMPEIFFCGMLQYDGDALIPKNYLVAPPVIERTMGEYLCAEKIRSFAVSETQKFGHVTYFWNGNRSDKLDEALETWLEIPSDVGDFREAPAMKAAEITEATIDLLRGGEHAFGRINFANGDMVGHSGDLAATVRAVEVVDECLARLRAAVDAAGGVMLVTADHGNADEMFVMQDGERIVRTAHSLNAVPFAIYDAAAEGGGAGGERGYEMAKVAAPGLANVAATVFNLLGYDAPAEYAESLIEMYGEPSG